MKEFEVTDGRTKFLMKLPTSINEITADYLNSVTKDVIIAPYHALIATVYRCKLPEVISSNRKSKAMAIAIVPLFVRANFGDNLEASFHDTFADIKTCDKLIIAGSDIERGYHIGVKNNLITIDNIVRIYNNDNSFAKGVISDQTYYYFVDFKLVAFSDIKGYYKDSEEKYDNPFVSIIDNNNAN